MLYRNKNTGAIVDVQATIGGAWEPLQAPKAQPVREVNKNEEPKQKKRRAKKEG